MTHVSLIMRAPTDESSETESASSRRQYLSISMRPLSTVTGSWLGARVLPVDGGLVAARARIGVVAGIRIAQIPNPLSTAAQTAVESTRGMKGGKFTWTCQLPRAPS